MQLWIAESVTPPHLTPSKPWRRCSFIGSEAFAAGKVTKYDLRARYQRLLPDVYTVKGTPPSLRDRTVATWLWSQRQGVISGIAASA